MGPGPYERQGQGAQSRDQHHQMYNTNNLAEEAQNVLGTSLSPLAKTAMAAYGKRFCL